MSARPESASVRTHVRESLRQLKRERGSWDEACHVAAMILGDAVLILGDAVQDGTFSEFVWCGAVYRYALARRLARMELLEHLRELGVRS